MRSPVPRRPGRRPAATNPTVSVTSLLSPPPRTDRGVSPVAGVLLVALVVGLAAATMGAVFALADASGGTSGRGGVGGDAPPRASLSVVATGQTLSFTHHGGDALDVRRLRLVVAVDGDPLAHQPPVPFFSARGFRSGPTGPFNSATDPRWTAGETATLRIAGTNRPTLSSGDVVSVRVFADGALVARLSARRG
jgi:FlaG/FlaF family flagellin (archaellin)